MALLHPFSLFYTQKVFLTDRSILFSSLDFYPVTYLSLLTYSTYSFRIEFIPQIYTKRYLSLSLLDTITRLLLLSTFHMYQQTQTLSFSLSLSVTLSHTGPFVFSHKEQHFLRTPPFVMAGSYGS